MAKGDGKVFYILDSGLVDDVLNEDYYKYEDDGGGDEDDNGDDKNNRIWGKYYRFFDKED